MNTLDVVCELGALAPNAGADVQHQVQVVDLTVLIDGKHFASTKTPTASAPVLGAFALLAGRLRGSQLFVLTCRCGIPECAGIFVPVEVRRSRELVSWTFHREYFGHLLACGLAVGEPREVTFEFERGMYEAKLEAAEDFAATAEIGGRLVSLGEDEMPVRRSILVRLAAQRQRMAELRNESWYARGIEGGAPYRVVRPVSRAGQTPGYPQALPILPSVDHGRRMGVGSPVHHLVYQWHYDQRVDEGHWAYAYSQRRGEAVEAMSVPEES